MDLRIPIIAALLPVVLLFYYIYRKDSAQPEPPKWLWKAVGFGVLSAILVIIVGQFIPDPEMLGMGGEDSVPGALYTAFCCAAIPEEACKLLMLWLVLRKNPYFDEHLDGIVYAACVGLGFAGLENIFYIFGNLDSLAVTAIMRGLFSVPGHFFFAVVMGYFYSLASFASRTESERKHNYMLAFAVPMVLHGIYDGLLMVSDADETIAGVCIIAFLIFCFWLQKAGRKRIAIMKKKDGQ